MKIIAVTKLFLLKDSHLDKKSEQAYLFHVLLSVLQQTDSQQFSSVTERGAEHRAACSRHSEHGLGVAHQVLGQLTALTEPLNNGQTSRS